MTPIIILINIYKMLVIWNFALYKQNIINLVNKLY